VYITGQVVLDGPDLARAVAADEQAVVRGIIAHELGHLVGLDHVDAPDQLMYPETDGTVTEFQAGDVRGLARLGAGACFPEI
jgi:predicted Zn-dependent protease